MHPLNIYSICHEICCERHYTILYPLVSKSCMHLNVYPFINLYHIKFAHAAHWSRVTSTSSVHLTLSALPSSSAITLMSHSILVRILMKTNTCKRLLDEGSTQPGSGVRGCELNLLYLLLFFKNKAVYTAILVACGLAGAVISLCKPRNSKIRAH